MPIHIDLVHFIACLSFGILLRSPNVKSIADLLPAMFVIVLSFSRSYSTAVGLLSGAIIGSCWAFPKTFLDITLTSRVSLALVLSGTFATSMARGVPDLSTPTKYLLSSLVIAALFVLVASFLSKIIKIRLPARHAAIVAVCILLLDQMTTRVSLSNALNLIISIALLILVIAFLISVNGSNEGSAFRAIAIGGMAYSFVFFNEQLVFLIWAGAATGVVISRHARQSSGWAARAVTMVATATVLLVVDAHRTTGWLHISGEWMTLLVVATSVVFGVQLVGPLVPASGSTSGAKL